MAYRSPDLLAPLAHRLRAGGVLSDAEQTALLALPHTLRTVPAGFEIVREGDEPSQCCLVLSGAACRFKIVADGKRQIVAFEIPGDFCDLQSLLLEQLDHTISTVTESRLAFVPHRALRRLVADHPSIGQALWRETLIEISILREWTCNVGRRSALSRVAHLFCEIYHRSRVVGINDGDSIDFPYTQADIADAQGLTAIHVNRMIATLAKQQLITLNRRVLTIHDLDGLKRVGDFDETYLHRAD